MTSKTIVWSLIAITLTAACIYEWRYSDDMQEHINTVNVDLENARLNAALSTGLAGSLQAMTAATDVAGEIMSTREHVHTLKDEVLAWKIKNAVEESVTVGDAIRNVIPKWQESI